MKKKIILIIISIIMVTIIFTGVLKIKHTGDVMQKEPVNVVFTIDNNYVLFTGLAMNSIFKNSDSKFKFYIIENGLKKRNKLFLKYYVKSYGSEIEYIHKNTDEYKNIYNSKSERIPYITTIAMARIFIPELLPENISKVLYLDADILAIDDIKKLYDIDLQGKPLGMAEQGKRTYFNDGVILMDLNKWRENHLTQKLVDYYEKNVLLNPKDYTLPDQDLINEVLKDDIYKIPSNWNVYGRYKGSMISKQKKLSKHNAAVLFHLFHYYGPTKPWQSINDDSPGFKIYQQYWNRSIFVLLKPYYQIKSIQNNIKTKNSIFHTIRKKYRKFKRKMKRKYKKSV